MSWSKSESNGFAKAMSTDKLVLKRTWEPYQGFFFIFPEGIKTYKNASSTLLWLLSSASTNQEQLSSVFTNQSTCLIEMFWFCLQVLTQNFKRTLTRNLKSKPEFYISMQVAVTHSLRRAYLYLLFWLLAVYLDWPATVYLHCS